MAIFTLLSNIGEEPGFIVMLHDISKRLKIESVLRDNTKKHRGLVEAAGEGVISLDARHSILFVNHTLADRPGYSREHMIGQPVTRFMNVDCADILISRLSGDDDRSVKACKVGLKKSDGSNAWARMTVNQMTGKDGSYSGALVMVSDLTERKAMEIKLIESRANTRLYLDMVEREIGKMDQIVMGYLDATDDILD